MRDERIEAEIALAHVREQLVQLGGLKNPRSDELELPIDEDPGINLKRRRAHANIGDRSQGRGLEDSVRP